MLGVHGAALAGIVFCKKKTNFCEIQSRSHSFPYFQSLAISAGHKTHIVKYGNSNSISLYKKLYGLSMTNLEIDQTIELISEVLSSESP